MGPGNTETEAPESPRNSWLERIFKRNRREKLHYSGSGSGTGSERSSAIPGS